MMYLSIYTCEIEKLYCVYFGIYGISDSVLKDYCTLELKFVCALNSP